MEFETIETILDSVKDSGLKEVLENLYDVVLNEFSTKPSSVKYHHSEVGGMGRHVMEVMNIALDMYNAHPNWYKCSRDDVIVATFIHDFNKLGKYGSSEPWMQQAKYGGRMFMYNKNVLKMDPTAQTVSICAAHGLLLTPAQINAVSYHHGGWTDGNLSMNDMHPLAILLHSADLISGNIFAKPNEDSSINNIY